MKKNIRPESTILSIDVGTQSIRGAVIDPRGNFIGIARTEIEPYYSLKPGWAEQDPGYFWSNLALTMKKLFRLPSVDKNALRGVAITTQRNTMVNLDASGTPLRPAIIWLDKRRARKEAWPPLHIKAALKAMNLYDSVIYLIKDAESNWIRQNEPEIWEKTRKYLFLSGYLTYRLTGEFRDSSACQVGYVPFDFKKHAWAEASHIYWKMIPMDRDILPELVRPGEVLGNISPEASRATGIPKGLPLIAAATDKACEVLGSGCLDPGIACLSYGTTATIETTNTRYIEVVPFIPPFPSAVPGSYNTEVMIYRGYWLVSWFKKEFGHPEVLMARKTGAAPETLFDRMIRDIPPGSMGLMLQPFWSPGVKIPGPEAKGSIIGFGDVHTRAHVYRAILEGLAYALKEGAIRTENRNKVRIGKLRVSGGGSQSDVAMQITADIFDLPAERPRTFETSALGAAIDAAVGLGIHRDFESAVKEMTGIRDVFLPIKGNRDIYKELFEQVYLGMYKKMKPLYESIRRITGYPGMD